MTDLDFALDGGGVLAATAAATAAAVGDLQATNQAAGALVIGSADIPTLTGYLGSTVAASADDQTVTLSASAPYAGYVHARRPFLTDAVNKQTDAVTALYLDHLTEAIDNIKGA